MKVSLLKICPVFMMVALVAAGCRYESLPEEAGLSYPEVPVIAPANCRDLSSFMAGNKYDWDNLERGVPPFILETLPPDFDSVTEIREKKRLFYLSLLPMVLMVNEEISRQRQEVIDALQRYDEGFPLTPAQHQNLLDRAKEYRVLGNPLLDTLARRTLLRRLDILPPSLVLAQAANESAYGTSRFALEGNNLFGEWTFAPGTGMVPRKRAKGETHEVRRFATLYDSVKAYMKNLNSHRAYGSLRELRAMLREKGMDLRGVDLAAGLRLYSARRDVYVREIRSMIRNNNLSRLSSVSLQKPLASTAIRSPERNLRNYLLAAK
jgi:Bax protein